MKEQTLKLLTALRRKSVTSGGGREIDNGGGFLVLRIVNSEYVAAVDPFKRDEQYELLSSPFTATIVYRINICRAV